MPACDRVGKEGAGPEDLARVALGVIDFEVLDERPVSFQCTCSLEKAAGMIAALGEDEIRAMIEEESGAVMNCGFCNETYDLTNADLAKLLSTPD